jgi:hypothetical protein
LSVFIRATKRLHPALLDEKTGLPLESDSSGSTANPDGRSARASRADLSPAAVRLAGAAAVVVAVAEGELVVLLGVDDEVDVDDPVGDACPVEPVEVEHAPANISEATAAPTPTYRAGRRTFMMSTFSSAASP